MGLGSRKHIWCKGAVGKVAAGSYHSAHVVERGVKEEEHALGEQRKWMALALALGRQEVKGGGSPGGIWL